MTPRISTRTTSRRINLFYRGLLFIAAILLGLSAQAATSTPSHVYQAVDPLDKKFSAPLFVSTPDNKLLFRNSDSMDHNVYADDKRAGVKFDVGLMQPAAEEEISVNWDEAALVRIGCKIHPKMKAYVANVPSDEFVQLDFSNKIKKRQFVFQVNKPDGVEVKLILPRFNPVSLTLVKGQPQTVELVKGKKVKGSVTLALQ